MKLTIAAFILCLCFVVQSIAQPTNDNCPGAISVSVGTSSCGTTVNADFTTATESGVGTISCFGQTLPIPGVVDLWYSFVAPGSGIIAIEVTGNAISAIYSGTCGALSPLDSCVVNAAGGLVPGTTYYLRMMASTTTSNASFCMQELDVPVNDDCATATAVSPGPVGVCGPSVIADSRAGTSSGVPTACYGFIPHDVWFSFVAPSSGNVVIDYLNGSPSTMLYSGTCGALVEEPCIFSGATVSGLTPGGTYYLRMTTSSAVEFCLEAGPTAPLNSDCATPETVNVGSGGCGTTAMGNNTWANDSGEAAPSCGSYAGGDLWFDFVAPPSGTILFDLIAQDFFPNFTLYSGSCGSLTELQCWQGNLNSIRQIPGLTPGNTFLIRVFDGGNNNYGDFSFCLEEGPAPPLNDLCTGAISVTVGSGTCGPVVNGTNNGATDSGVPAPGCSLYEGGDIWYSFTAPTTGNVEFMLQTSDWDVNHALYAGTCGGLTEVGCNSAQYAGLTPGNTYYLRLWDFGYDEFGNVSFCLEEGPAPPVNDLCSGAIAVPVGSGSCGPTVTATNNGATDSGTPAPACANNQYSGGDLWYSFTAPASTTVYLNIISENWGAVRYVAYSNSCGTLTELDCGALSSTSPYNQGVILGLTSGNTYYLRLYDDLNNQIGTVDFCLEEAPPPPPNDLCTNAIPLTLGVGSCGPTVVGSNVLAQDSGESTPSCGSYAGGDIWYSVVAPATGSFEVDLISEQWNTVNLGFYQGTCGALTEILCFSSVTPSSNLQFTGLTPGSTYYLRWWDRDNDDIGTITFCAQEGVAPPANDDCANAVPVVVGSGSCGPAATGTNHGATSSSQPPPGCQNYVFGDIWYSFTAPTSGSVYLETIANDWFPSIAFAVYSGSCGTLTEEYCDESALGAPSLITGLVSGNTYYLRLWDSNGTDFGNVSFCLEEGPNAPPNDLCSGAITVPLGLDVCGAVVTGTNVASSDSGVPDPGCGQYAGGDIWYSFTAPASGEIEIDMLTSQWESLSSGSAQHYYALYSGTCGSLSLITCNDFDLEFIPPTTINYKETLSGLTPGSTYYLRLWDRSNQNVGQITFCAKEIPAAPINDDCSNATTLLESTDENCNNSISGTTLGATSNTNTACSANAEEVFYQFTASESANYTIALSGFTQAMKIEIFQGNCVSLSTLACGSTTLTVALNGSETYLVSVSTEDPALFSAFDLCAYKAIPGSGQGNVGVGITNPVEKLQVNGAVMIGNTGNANVGAIRFTGVDFEGYNGSEWKSFSSVGTDNLADHTATQPLDMSLNPIHNVFPPTTSFDAANKDYVDSHADADASTSNEKITSVNLAGTILTINEPGNSKNVDLAPLGGSDDLGNHTATQPINMSNHAISNLADPVTAQDAATKAYVDGNTGADTDWITSGSDMYSGVSGNVGIGETSPDADLEINGPGETDAIMWDAGRGVLRHSADALSWDRPNFNMFIDADNNNNNNTVDHTFQIFTNTNQSSGNTPKFSLDLQGGDSYLNSGRFGIGVTTPDRALSVVGTISSNFDATEAERTDIGHGGGNGFLNTVGDGNLDFRHDNATLMSLTDAGDLGIGTTAPSADLEVLGTDNTNAIVWDNDNARLRHHSDLLVTDRDFINILLDANNDQTNAKFSLYKNSATSTGQTASVNFNLDGLPSWISTGGKLGINTTIPVGQLTLKQASPGNGEGIRFVSFSNNFSWEIRHTNGNDNLRFRSFNTSGTPVITSEISSATGAFVPPSDIRLKKNIDPLETSLENIRALTPVRYHFSHVEEDQNRTIGLIAQDVRALYPGLVEEKGDGMLGLNYDGIAVLAIQGVKELVQHNEKQQAEIDKLKQQNTELHKMISEVLQRLDNLENNDKHRSGK